MIIDHICEVLLINNTQSSSQSVLGYYLSFINSNTNTNKKNRQINNTNMSRQSGASSDAAAILQSFKQNANAPQVFHSSHTPPAHNSSSNARPSSSRPSTTANNNTNNNDNNNDFDNENSGLVVSLLHKYEPVLPRLTNTVLEEQEKKIYSSRNQVQQLLCSSRGVKVPPLAVPPSQRSANPVVAAQQQLYSDFIQEQRNSPRTSARVVSTVDETTNRILANPVMPPGSARSVDDDVHSYHPVVRSARFPETKYERESARTRAQITVGSGLRNDNAGLKELAKSVAEEGAPSQPSYTSVGSRFFDPDVARKKTVVGEPLQFSSQPPPPAGEGALPRESARVKSHAEALYVSSIVLARTREENSFSTIPPPVPKTSKIMSIPFPQNLTALVNTFVTCAKGDRQLSFYDASLALALLDVTNQGIVKTFCGMMDVHQDRSIDFDVLLSVLDSLINSLACAAKVREACFEPFNLKNQGYIHRDHLADLRSQAGPDSNASESKITPVMVKQLSDAFNILRQLEEEQYILKVVKRGKKKRKVPPLPALASSFMPTSMMKTEHISFEMFCRLFDQKPEFAAAFASIWLPLVLQEPHLQRAGVMRSIAAVKMQEELVKDPPPPPPVPPPKKKKKKKPDQSASNRFIASMRQG